MCETAEQEVARKVRLFDKQFMDAPFDALPEDIRALCFALTDSEPEKFAPLMELIRWKRAIDAVCSRAVVKCLRDTNFEETLIRDSLCAYIEPLIEEGARDVPNMLLICRILTRRSTGILVNRRNKVGRDACDEYMARVTCSPEYALYKAAIYELSESELNELRAIVRSVSARDSHIQEFIDRATRVRRTHAGLRALRASLAAESAVHSLTLLRALIAVRERRDYLTRKIDAL